MKGYFCRTPIKNAKKALLKCKNASNVHYCTPKRQKTLTPQLLILEKAWFWKVHEVTQRYTKNFEILPYPVFQKQSHRMWYLIMRNGLPCHPLRYTSLLRKGTWSHQYPWMATCIVPPLTYSWGAKNGTFVYQSSAHVVPVHIRNGGIFISFGITSVDSVLQGKTSNSLIHTTNQPPWSILILKAT